MPNQSGVWTLSQQFQARGQGLWPAPPGAPTIGTATAGTNLCASVTFTAPACTGYPAGVTGYTVTSTPGCITKTGASSPLVVTGLTNGTSYTFKVKATNATGTGPCSAASNSVTASSAVVGQATYTSAGTFTWVAPAGVTSISLAAVGAGGRGGSWNYVCCPCTGTFYAGGGGGGGGGLIYQNNRTVSPGSSYTIQVGRLGTNNGQSWFQCNATGATPGSSGNGRIGGAGGSNSGGVITASQKGGAGGDGVYSIFYSCQRAGGGGGAAGYSGPGGGGGSSSMPAYGSGGAAAGGQAGSNIGVAGNGGGGVGFLGQGTTGSSPSQAGSSGSNGTTSGSGLGGNYGGGSGGGTASVSPACPGSTGFVRIIYPGTTRAYPSTCTADK